MNVFSQINRSLILAVLLMALVLTPVMAAPSSSSDATATLSGEVYMDGNVNRIREPLETGINDVRIVLRGASGEYVTETTTDIDGYYVFNNLEADTYQIQVVPPSGYIITDNGSVDVTIGEVGALPLISTSLLFGVFVPLVSR